MPLPQELERQLKQAHGVSEIMPIVVFVDWALKDEELSKQCGRPRYKDCIFLEKHPRGTMVKDVFRRRMEEQDKRDYPKEWAEYQARKSEIANRAPPITAMPGMTRAVFEELRELGLTDCEKVAGYEGDLQEIEPFRRIAQQIMEISNVQSRAFREGRQEVREEVHRPLHGVDGGRWAGGGTYASGGAPPGTPVTFTEAPKETSQEGYETFRYVMTA